MTRTRMSDNLIDSFAQLVRKQWYRGPSVSDLDEAGRRLYFRSADLAARLCMNGEAMDAFGRGNFAGCATLIHAERYLADRLAYELEGGWPKGKISFLR